MKKEKQLVCDKCKFPILVGMKYARHENGKILCEDCFKEMIESGEIE